MYKYLDIKNAKPGDVVKFSKQDYRGNLTHDKLYIVRSDNITGSPFLRIVADDRGDANGLPSKYFKLVATKPGSEAKVGDTVLKTENTSHDVSYMDICRIVKVNKNGWLRVIGATKYPQVDVNLKSDTCVVLCKEEPKSSPNKLDIDYWQNQYEQGHDVWVETRSYTDKCKNRSPKEWSAPIGFYSYDPKTPTKKPQQGTTMKKKTPHYKVFDKKGNINVKGVMYQHAKTGKDRRPFVQDIIAKERNKIQAAIKRTDFATHYEKHAPYCDLRLLQVIITLKEYKDRLERSETVLSSAELLNYYEFKKLAAQKTDYTWIAKYLTHDNIAKPLTCLFESNKLQVRIESGSIVASGEFNAKVPIKYNEETKQFHL